MELLMVRVEPYTIHLMWRWRRNTMMYYLYTTAKSFTDGLAIRMFQYGDYTLILPAHADV